MKRSLGFALLVLGLGFGSAARLGAVVQFDAGGGMEYYTSKLLVYDHQGKMFSTLIQSTLAIAQLKLVAGPWELSAQGGWSDWPVSGQWAGSGIVTTGADYFLWSRQRSLALEAGYQLLDQLSIGARYSAHGLDHFEPDTNDPYLSTVWRSLGVRLGGNLIQDRSIRLKLIGGFSPRERLEVLQETHVPVGPDAVQDYTTAVEGWGWQGELNFTYSDDRGWGLEFGYELASSEFAPPDNLSGLRLRQGRLSGVLRLVF